MEQRIAREECSIAYAHLFDALMCRNHALEL